MPRRADGVAFWQFTYLKEESLSKNGAHLNFDVYGKLNSWVWRENQPVPDGIPGIIKCNVAFGMP